MDNLKTIYKILSFLEQSLDYEQTDTDRLRAEGFGISENRFNAIMIMLTDSGYITGLTYKRYVGEEKLTISGLERVRITLAGLEYLNENGTMKKIAAAAKGIVDVIGIIK